MPEAISETGGRFVEPDAKWFRELSQLVGAIFFKMRSNGGGWDLEYLSGDLASMLGYTTEEYLENPALLPDLVHPEDRDLMGLHELPVGEIRDVEIRCRHRDGHEVLTQVTYRKRASADGSMVAEGVATDITGLREAERAARLDRERLRAAMDAMLDPQFLLQAQRDADGTIVDFVYVDVNDAAARHLHAARDQILGTQLLETVPGHQDGLLQEYAHVVDTGEPLIADGVTYADEMQGGQERLFDMRGVKVGDAISLTIRDVTERELAAEALAASQERYRLLAHNATDMVYRTDIDGNIEWVSDGVTKVLGYTPAQFIGRNALDLAHPEDRQILEATMAGSDLNTRRSVRLRVQAADGEFRWIEALIQTIADGMEQTSGYVGGIRDVNAEVEALNELDHRARTDMLTGMLNREEGIRQLDELLTAGEGVALAFCDLDNFKQVNDTLGHAAGDALLGEAAARTKAAVRSGDVVARFGGDEITVVLRGVQDADQAAAAADKIRVAIAEPVTTPGGEVATTVSIGVALAHAGDSADDVIARADAAMYEAKSGGRNQVVVQT